jgi:HAD superfamily hydrolase (TIGR01509 family)
VCSASNEKAVAGVLAGVLGARAKQVRVFTADAGVNAKPAPDVYLLAATELGVHPALCVVFEDTEEGCRAARAANMRCIVTHNGCAAAVCAAPSPRRPDMYCF